MAEQDDLSQLMPVLYSKVKLTTTSDETAGLAMYTAAHNALAAPHVLVAPAVALVQSETLNHMPSQMLEAVRRPSGLIEAKLSKGTGRPVGRRGFDLCFRLVQAKLLKQRGCGVWLSPSVL